MKDEIAALPQPQAPPDLAPAVLARIARLEVAAVEAPPRRASWTVWATVAGAAVALALPALRLGRSMSGFTVLPQTAAEMTTLVVGLAVYMAGLLLTLRRTPRQSI